MCLCYDVSFFCYEAVHAFQLFDDRSLMGRGRLAKEHARAFFPEIENDDRKPLLFLFSGSCKLLPYLVGPNKAGNSYRFGCFDCGYVVLKA